MMHQAKELRGLFASDKLIRVMGAHNSVGAKLVGQAGFDAVRTNTLEISTIYTEQEDNILTLRIKGEKG